MTRTAFAPASAADNQRVHTRELSMTDLGLAVTAARRPTFLQHLAHDAVASHFDSLAELAAHVRRAAGQAVGLRLSHTTFPTAWPGRKIFRAFSVYLIAEDQTETWLGSVSAPDLDLDLDRFRSAFRQAAA